MLVRMVAGLLLSLLTSSLAAQAPPPIAIKRTSAPVHLDGALNDAAWQDAAVIDTFFETSPGDNIPAKVKTVAYLMYDARYFYIGVRADDPEPRRIRAPFVDRDGVIGTDDNIAIFLDTRNDKRSAIELRVNPRGIQADGIFNDANGSEDFSPDFYYDTAATIGDTGWSAEFRIPFSSLRYGSDAVQTWNILVWRNYPRDFRYAFHSAPLPRGSNCIICHTHAITGFTDLPRASHLVAAPYVTAQRQELATFDDEGNLGPLGDAGFKSDLGADLKWTPGANDTVDVTINPDFSQIEADVPQIAVNTRFALFYPEKRPFFLEGFDLFDTPLQIAYTRTIVDPRAGVRATGKRGATAYTLLVTEDRGGGDTIIPGPTFSGSAPQVFKSYATIGRVRHDIGSSFVGAVLTSREIDGGGHNRVFGPDGQWRPNDSDALTAQFLVSDTTNPRLPLVDPDWNGESARSHAFTAEFDRQKRGYDWSLSGRDVGDGFRADLGFIPQNGYRELAAFFGLRYYPEGKVRFFRPSIGVTQQRDRDDDTIYESVSLGVNGFGVKNTQFSALFYPKETILVGDRLLEQTYGRVFVQFDPSRRIPRITLDTRFGEQIDFGGANVGNGAYLGLSTTVRPHDRLDLQFTVNREWLDVESSRLYTADVQRIRGQYSFSAKSLVRVIAQYVDAELGNDFHDGGFLGSVLYSYKLNWQTVLFVGFGDERALVSGVVNDDQPTQTVRTTLEPTGRTLFFKVSYAFLR